ncbi:Beta-1,4-xylosyltransferase IRX14 [Citrus sinensis]|nr:Beta-1,4-xylosyltransferase IRX14 [Citrus sinensis]
MKLSALQQSYLSRRSNSFRASAPLDSSSDSAIKSPAAIFWLVLHGLCCLISLVLGFRFSRLVFFFIFSTSTTSTTNLYTAPFRNLASDITTPFVSSSTPVEIPVLNRTTPNSNSRVVVGRHGIRIRPWPHPNPTEVMKAHKIIERVQREQRAHFGFKNPRTLIVVTPTYVRTFQTLHLTGVMHSLMLVPYDLVWIVVEAGGVTNETASLIAKSKLRTIHVGVDQKMPASWGGRHQLEAKMRLRALRIVREEKLDGIVMFADDSNMHSMELFDEIQNVKWFGAVSVGILALAGNQDESSSVIMEKEEGGENTAMPVQGPACNSSNNLVGWHTFNSLPYARKSATYIDDRATVLPRKLEWAGFVLNSRLLWKEAKDKPEWVNDLDLLDGLEDIESPLSLLKDQSMVEPLGNCGRQVIVWWLRVEARSDSKFPPGWIIDPPLEITVPSKRTPWPDAPPELPSNEKVLVGIQEHTVKHTPKNRSSRSKRSSRTALRCQEFNLEADILRGIYLVVGT